MIYHFYSLLFVCHCHLAHPDLHSFPTRRSSDLSSPGPTRESPPSSPGAGFCQETAPRDSWPLAPLVFRDCRSEPLTRDRKSTRLNSSHLVISYAVFCLKKKKKK